jgi:hypothetical protein
MLKRCSLTIIVTLFLLSGNVYAQPWSSILAPSRAADWSNAGVVGGIPSLTWTQCGSTIAAGASAATINSAIQSCTASHYILLNSGTFNLTTGLVMKTGVVVRGMGADQTKLVFTGNNSCMGIGAAVCMAGGDSSDYFANYKTQPGGTNSATWTSGYRQGTTNIVLNNIGSNGISVGKYIYLDQAEDTATNSGFFVCENSSASPPCSAEGGSGDPGRVVNGVARQQVQIVKVTACSPSCTNGSTFTISPGLYAPNYASGYSPGAWWPSSSIENSGVEDLSIDATNAGGQANIFMFNARNVWVKGTRQIRSCVCNRSIIWMWQTAHATVQNNYIYGTSGQSQNYGVESYIASDALVVNNIFQHTVGPNVLHSNTGSVYAYNYAINDTYDDGGSPQYHYMMESTKGHSAGVMYNLFEGNIGVALGGDAVHGNQVMNTAFRNYFRGSDANRIDNTFAISLEAWNRYWNIIGNVLGTPGFTATYAGTKPGIYQLGAGRGSISDDPVVATTMMRWGNYDTVNAAVRWQNSEIPTSAPTYPNSVPSSQTLPASFYLSSQPSWWPSGKAWPPIGPDVTGGNISNLGGHAHTIPAQDCYLNVMGGPANGTGSVLNFNASACYASSGRILPPSGLRVE